MKSFIYIVIVVVICGVVNGQDSHSHDHDHEECFSCKQLDEWDCRGCIDSLCAPIAFNSTEYKCMVAKGAGENCIPNQCKTGLVCSGYSEKNNVLGRCVNGYFATLGEQCKDNTDCVGYPSDQSCFNGKCSNLKKDCIGDYNCAFDQVCSNQTCTNKLKTNDLCDPLVPNCPFTDYCHLTTKRCTKFYSGQQGDMCAEVKQCDIAQNLNCLNMTCQKIDTSTCTTDNCMSCSCGGKCMIQSFGQPKKDATNKYLECIEMNKCKLNGNIYSDNSCIKQHCAKEFCAYEQSYDNGIFCGAKVVPACIGVDLSDATKPLTSLFISCILVLFVILL